MDRSVDVLILPWHPRDLTWEENIYGPGPYILDQMRKLSGSLPSLVLQGFVYGDEPECHLFIGHTPYRPNTPEWRRNSGWMRDVQIRQWVFAKPEPPSFRPERKEIVTLHPFHTISEDGIPLSLRPTTLGEALLSLSLSGDPITQLLGHLYSPYFRVTVDTFAQRLTTALVNRYVNAGGI